MMAGKLDPRKVTATTGILSCLTKQGSHRVNSHIEVFELDPKQMSLCHSGLLEKSPKPVGQNVQRLINQEVTQLNNHNLARCENNRSFVRSSLSTRTTRNGGK